MRHVSLFVLLMGPTVLVAQRDAKIPDSDPEIERKSFIVAPGFEVNLWAADPLLAKPIQMNWDPQGRLWVATSETYPQILPGQKANDKIIILEDTKGAGVADKTTVFADGLLIPTGIEPGDGGAYVANSTELVHLSASKPGQKADRKKVLLSGFGTEDTHHIIHTFRWGPDGCLYFNQSIYIHSHLETPKGVQRLNAGGIWKYNPRTQDLNVFARGWVNSWGHAFDKYGQSFTTDGAGGEGINHVVPGAYYLTSQGPHASRILHGMNPGSPKHCGLEIISGRHFPDDWQGNMITNDFRGHRVCRFQLQEDGSTYSSREMPELIKTAHPAFRPIDVKMGPDGAIYIADWYNPIIQHGEVDFRDPRRDHTHGRIWRVTAKGRPLVKKPKLETTDDAFQVLSDPEDWTRQQARRVLLEKVEFDSDGRKKLPELLSKYSDPNIPAIDAIFLNQHLTKHPYIQQSNSGSLFAKPLSDLLNSKNDSERSMAIRYLPDSINENQITHPIKNSIHDSSPKVRLEAIRSVAGKLQFFSLNVHPAEFAMQALDHPMDPTLDYALWLTMRELEPIWLPAFQKGEITFGNDPKKIAFAMKASGSPEAMKTLAGMLQKDSIPKEQRREIAKVLASIGGAEQMATIVKRGFTDSEILGLVEEAFRSRRFPDVKLSQWESLPSLAANESIRPTVYRLLGHTKFESQREALEKAAIDSKSSAVDRQAAFDGIVLLGGIKSRNFLEKQAQPGPVDRSIPMTSLIKLDIAFASKMLKESLTGVDLTSLATTMVAQRGGADQLKAILKGKSIPADDAKRMLGKLRTSGTNDANLTNAIIAAGKLNAIAPFPTEAEVKTLAADVAAKGNAARGEMIYRRSDLQCLKCHAIGGVGGQVGPDMTSLGSSAQPDYIVESLLNPNAKVKEGYNAIRIVMTDGKQHQGVKVREADGKLVIRNAEDAEVSLPVAEIDEKSDTRSLMPDGLTQVLTNQEFLDLSKFLSELGKVGPYAPNPARLMRVWEFVEPKGTNTERMRRTRATIAAEAENGLTWGRTISLVSGELPLSDVPLFQVWANNNRQSAIRTKLDVTQPGAVRLKFNDVNGLSLFVDGKPVDVKSEVDVTVAIGQPTITILMDRSKRAANLMVELLDVPGSKAMAKPVMK